jgi:hypothetical protein
MSILNTLPRPHQAFPLAYGKPKSNLRHSSRRSVPVPAEHVHPSHRSHSLPVVPTYTDIFRDTRDKVCGKLAKNELLLDVESLSYQMNSGLWVDVIVQIILSLQTICSTTELVRQPLFMRLTVADGISAIIGV